MTRALAWTALGAAFLACGRVPEAQLRDEQSRARHYRDAYETELGENQSLRKRLATAERRPQTCPSNEASAPAKPADAAPK